MSGRQRLDTDSVSYALRGHGNVGERIRSHRPSEIRISAITAAEFRFGAERKASKRLHALVDAFIGAVEVAAFDHAAALEFGRLGNILAMRGTPTGEFDVVIAAHAVTLRCVFVSNNVRHFSKVPRLIVENWT